MYAVLCGRMSECMRNVRTTHLSYRCPVLILITASFGASPEIEQNICAAYSSTDRIRLVQVA